MVTTTAVTTIPTMSQSTYRQYAAGRDGDVLNSTAGIAAIR
jgi:hypothetical protein